MIKNLVLYLSLLTGFNTFAQNIKTDVLVIGNNSAAFAAAIQAAKSGVKTVLIDAGKFESMSISDADKAVKSGVYADFLKRVDTLQKKSGLKDNQNLTPAFTATVFRGWTDTIKNLTRISGAALKKVDKNGKGWEIDFVGREIKADVLVDATTDLQAARMAGLAINSKSVSPIDATVYGNNKYRTSVAMLKKANKYVPVPLSSLIVTDIENLILAGPIKETASMGTAQAAGASAAYCAFFNKSTKNFNLKSVREIQTELLTYKAKIFSFADVADNDSSNVSFQHIGVTGLLKGKDESDKLLFLPETTVSTEELKQPFREFYSRSQIWFLDNKADKITLEQALSLIKFVGSRAGELDREVEKAWQKSLRLTGNFDLKRVLTRREFAILLDRYLQPFVVYVDQDGNIKR